jgi:CheY-like chemotaxis protein
MTEGLQLAGEVLHELRQPLVGIKAYVQMLRDEGNTQVPVNHLLAQVERMELIISDFARISSDKPAPLEKVNLAQSVRNAQQLFSGNMEASRLSVEVDAPPIVEIQGNERLLEQLTLNLLLNARDAMSGLGKIKVVVQREPQGNALYVADWGPGIPAEMAARIFQPYVTTKPRGSGLGLTVCQRIAQDHGAQISLVPPETLTDKPPAATVFRVLFPSSSVDAKSSRKKLLVVDDEPIIQMVFKDLMGRECEVVVADTAEDALDHLNRTSFDLIITDKNLPGLSGMDLAQQARRLDPSSRVILMTGYPSLVTAQQAIELGVVDYLLKPFDDIREVREKLRSALTASTPVPFASVTRRVDVFEDNPTTGRQLVDALSMLGLEARVLTQPPTDSSGPSPAGVIVSWDYSPAPGAKAVSLARRHGGGAPFVVLADHLTLETTLACLRGGAAACLPKALGDPRALCRDLSRALKLN